MTLCPYREGIFCNDGYPSKHNEQPGEHKCDAWKQPDAIHELCISEICKRTASRNGESYNYAPCELCECPYTGCSRHKIVKNLSSWEMDKLVIVGAKKVENKIATRQQRLTTPLEG